MGQDNANVSLLGASHSPKYQIHYVGFTCA